MKLITLSIALLFSFSALYAQSTENSNLSQDNPEYVEWVSSHGFKFLNELKPGQETHLASEILDAEGNPIPENVNPVTFEITKYDFETVVAPEKNILIKVSDNKAIMVYARQRQEVLFSRFLTNQNAKK